MASYKNKKVVISCGPIPARLDSVKFITNRFKGGLAFKTAISLIEKEYDVTIVMWEHTQLPAVDGQRAEFWMQDNVHIVTVSDVFDYYKWFKDNATAYDAFIMAAAVANLTPSNPFPGKFPSHDYNAGEQFHIKFEIAPRAIDIIKQLNPHACLIGYKLFDGSCDELIRAARLTQKESKANIIFANTPTEAKSKKYAVMADNSVIECSFDEHLTLMTRAIEASYFKTQILPLKKNEINHPAFRQAIATVKMFENTFVNGFGTVAVPVFPDKNIPFATTSRGYKGDPVIVHNVDFANMCVCASGKATLNAPSLAAALLKSEPETIIVHRHNDDPLYQHKHDDNCILASAYSFPGTMGEVAAINQFFENKEIDRICFLGHGDIRRLPIRPVDWNKYYEQFPDRYFSTPAGMIYIIEQHQNNPFTLEIGGNNTVCTKYAYDAFVPAQNAINLSWEEVLSKFFDLIVARNSINYFSEEQLLQLLSNCEKLVANTFVQAPTEKTTDTEAAILHNDSVYHTLRLPDDSICRHSFFAYTLEKYEHLAEQAEKSLMSTKYGKNNSMLLEFYSEES